LIERDFVTNGLFRKLSLGYGSMGYTVDKWAFKMGKVELFGPLGQGINFLGWNAP